MARRIESEELTHLGVKLVVSGWFTPYRVWDYNQPDEPATFELDEIKAGGVEITDLLSNEMRQEIADAVADKIQETE